MANCSNCGAPLSGSLLICQYCKTRQDVDLAMIHRFTIEKPDSERICPRCHIPLQTIDLHLGKKFYIERCVRCLGLFFDPGELEALLDTAVTHVYETDRQRLDELQNVKRSSEYPLGYIDCPVCKKLMNRINFGSRSGVIADKCRDHGLWLDGGELRQVLEWVKAGGDLYHKQKELEIKQLELEQEKKNFQFKVIDNAFSATREVPVPAPENYELDLLPMIARLLKKLFA
ncbi:MAG: zf-TFIIB domain-containing protein [Candidatus Aminicenantes bacterium]|nr:zf-TFIIB domain-containing protein [Candidatus Aminicenantes bacterium]